MVWNQIRAGLDDKEHQCLKIKWKSWNDNNWHRIAEMLYLSLVQCCILVQRLWGLRWLALWALVRARGAAHEPHSHRGQECKQTWTRRKTWPQCSISSFTPTGWHTVKKIKRTKQSPLGGNAGVIMCMSCGMMWGPKFSYEVLPEKYSDTHRKCNVTSWGKH